MSLRDVVVISVADVSKAVHVPVFTDGQEDAFGLEGICALQPSTEASNIERMKAVLFMATFLDFICTLHREL